MGIGTVWDVDASVSSAVPSRYVESSTMGELDSISMAVWPCRIVPGVVWTVASLVVVMRGLGEEVIRCFRGGSSGLRLES